MSANRVLKPERLYDKSVYLIPNTDEILKLVKKKMNQPDSTSPTPMPGAVEDLGTAHAGGGCDMSIGSTVSDAIVHSWLWTTATKSYPLVNFCRLLQVVDN